MISRTSLRVFLVGSVSLSTRHVVTAATFFRIVTGWIFFAAVHATYPANAPIVLDNSGIPAAVVYAVYPFQTYCRSGASCRRATAGGRCRLGRRAAAALPQPQTGRADRRVEHLFSGTATTVGAHVCVTVTFPVEGE